MINPHGESDASTVTAVPLPTSIRASTGLNRIDYWDAHAVPRRRPEVTAEQWLHEMLDHAVPFWRYGLPLGWRAIGLRHGRLGRSGHVLGWPIRETSADRVVLGATSRFGLPAELVLAGDGDTWVFATLVEFDNRAVAALWHAIGVPHRPIVRYLLRSAAARLAVLPAG